MAPLSWSSCFRCWQTSEKRKRFQRHRLGKTVWANLTREVQETIRQRLSSTLTMSCSPGIEMDSIFRPWPGCRERRSQYYYFSYLESRRLGHQTGRISDTLLQNRLYRDTCSHRMKKATGSKSRKYSDLESPRSDVWSYDVESCGTSIGPTGGIYNLEFNTDG